MSGTTAEGSTSYERYHGREEIAALLAHHKGEDGRETSRFLELLRDRTLEHFSGTEFASTSPLDPRDPFRDRVRAMLAGREKYASNAEDRAIGVMLGMVSGDAIGARVEFSAVRYGIHTLKGMGSTVGGAFQLKPGQWTDDSSMGLCVADSLLFCGGRWDPHDCMHRFLAWWNCGYDNAFRLDNDRTWKRSVGLGGNISMSFSYYTRNAEPYTTAGDKQTSGNGSVMRLAAVPICFHDDAERAMEVARLHSLTTHQGEEAAECCRLLTHIMVRGINGEPMHEVLRSTGETFRTPVASVAALARSEMENNDPDRDWRWRIDGQYKYSDRRASQQPGYVGSYAMDATAMALNSVWNSTSFDDAVLRAANVRGDADSVASVAGQVAGSFYGASTLPADWITTIQRWDDSDIALRAYRLFNKHWLI